MAWLAFEAGPQGQAESRSPAVCPLNSPGESQTDKQEHHLWRATPGVQGARSYGLMPWVAFDDSSPEANIEGARKGHPQHLWVFQQGFSGPQKIQIWEESRL